MKKWVFILIPALFVLFGCASNNSLTVFMLGKRYPQFLMIYTSEASDTVLVVSQGSHSLTYYSYHITQKVDSGLFLKNLTTDFEDSRVLKNDYFIPTSDEISVNDSLNLRGTSINFRSHAFHYNSFEHLKNRELKRVLKDLKIKWLK